MISLRWILILPLLASADRDEGARAFALGSFDEARQHFAAAVADDAEAADAELCFDWALSAFHSGNLQEVELALTRAERAARGAQIARCEFLRGNVYFERGERGAALAARAEAEPFAFDLAIRDLERAHVAWVRAALAQVEPEAAARNAERALRRSRELEVLRDRAMEERRKQDNAATPNPQPVPVAPESDVEAPRGDQSEAAAGDEPVTIEQRGLSAEELAAMTAKIAEREQQKRDLREVERRKRGSTGAQDW